MSSVWGDANEEVELLFDALFDELEIPYPLNNGLENSNNVSIGGNQTSSSVSTSGSGVGNVSDPSPPLNLQTPPGMQGQLLPPMSHLPPRFANEWPPMHQQWGSYPPLSTMYGGPPGLMAVPMVTPSGQTVLAYTTANNNPYASAPISANPSNSGGGLQYGMMYPGAPMIPQNADPNIAVANSAHIGFTNLPQTTSMTTAKRKHEEQMVMGNMGGDLSPQSNTSGVNVPIPMDWSDKFEEYNNLAPGMHPGQKQAMASSAPTASAASQNKFPSDNLGNPMGTVLLNGTAAVGRRQRVTASTFLQTLLEQFNAGETEVLTRLLHDHCQPNMEFHTHALNPHAPPLHGVQYACDFFESFYDAHPDAVFVAKGVRFFPGTHKIRAKLYLASTRVLRGNTIAGSGVRHSDYLWQRPGASLLDDMDTQGIPEAALSSMRELERHAKALTVFAKGYVELSLVNHLVAPPPNASGVDGVNGDKVLPDNLSHKDRLTADTILLTDQHTKISRMSVYWTINSFREAELQ